MGSKKFWISCPGDPMEAIYLRWLPPSVEKTTKQVWFEFELDESGVHSSDKKEAVKAAEKKIKDIYRDLEFARIKRDEYEDENKKLKSELSELKRTIRNFKKAAAYFNSLTDQKGEEVVQEECDSYRYTYDANYGDDKLCVCGHPYYRHFDTYDHMAAVGCKYCVDCPTFKSQASR